MIHGRNWSLRSIQGFWKLNKFCLFHHICYIFAYISSFISIIIIGYFFNILRLVKKQPCTLVSRQATLVTLPYQRLCYNVCIMHRSNSICQFDTYCTCTQIHDTLWFYRGKWYFIYFGPYTHFFPDISNHRPVCFMRKSCI